MISRRTEKTCIYCLFFLSGISGLIYEIVWLRVLGRVLGNTVFATATILAVFMTGLALGSWIIGKIVDKRKNLLRLYAVLELCIGLAALIMYLFFDKLIPLYQLIFTTFGEDRLILTSFQVALLFVLILVPTSLMGGTLPILSAHTRKYGVSFARRIGNLYGLNTLGAVVGVIGSGLLLIGAWGESNTLITGVIINLLVSLMAFFLVKQDVEPSGNQGMKNVSGALAGVDSVISPYPPRVQKIVLLAYALSGLTAVAYEIVWTRMLQLHLGSSIYAFSMMLGIYLLGVALGSAVGAKFANKLSNPLGFFGVVQIIIALYCILNLYLFTLFHTSHFVIDMTHMLLIPALMVFPVTFLFGLLFPVMSRSYVAREKKVGLGVGRLYALNTLGAIVGSLCCGFILMGAVGTRGTTLVLAGVNVIIGLWIGFQFRRSPLRSKVPVTVLALTLATLALGILSPDPFFTVVQREMKKFSQSVPSKDVEIFYHSESTVATTTALGSQIIPQAKQLWINGTGMTKLCIETKLMAHLPLLMNRNPEEMLIICFGMGTTLRSALTHSNVRCDTVEIVPEVYECFAFFHEDGEEILANPRVSHFVDDGRNFILMRDKAYDIITIDPSPPLWSSGTVNLYSREFLELCRNRLKDGGILCLWVMPGSFTEVGMILATFQSVFPNTTVWRGPRYPGVFLLGSNEPLKIDAERFRRANGNPKILADLTEWNRIVPTPESILGLHLLDPLEFAEFVQGFSIITDDHPYTEFPLWRQHLDETSRLIIDAGVITRWKASRSGVSQ